MATSTNAARCGRRRIAGVVLAGAAAVLPAAPAAAGQPGTGAGAAGSAAAEESPSPRAAGTIPDGYYVPRNRTSGKCLSGTGPRDGSRVVQWTCQRVNSQTWYFRNLGAGDAYEVRNRSSGRCLAVVPGQSADGAGVVQFSCAGATGQPPVHQTWYARTSGDSLVLANADSGRCLAIGRGRVDNGAPAVQWRCDDGNEDERAAPAWMWY